MDKFNREGKNLIISRFGVSEKCVRIIDDKFWLNDSGMTIHTKNDKYMQIVLNSMSGSTKEEAEQNYNKIIKNVIKKTVIDKTRL